jgi:integrase
VIKPKVSAVNPKKQVRKTTYYKIKLDHFIEHYGNKYVRDFDYGEAEEYKLILSEEIINKTGAVRAPKTIYHYLSEVKQMLGWAVNMRYLENNPMATKGFMPSTKAKNPRKPIPLSWIEDAIESTLNFKDKVYWTVLLHTGCRTTDAGSLTPENVETGIFQEKSGEYRKLMITPALLRFGDAIYNIYNESEIKESRKRFQEYISDKHNGYYVDFHSIRHTTISYLVNNGFDERQVGRILGTKSSVGAYVETDFNKCVEVISKNFKQGYVYV